MGTIGRDPWKCWLCQAKLGEIEVSEFGKRNIHTKKISTSQMLRVFCLIFLDVLGT